ncbi:MFS transporter [Brucella amazoniensis]
MRPFGALVFGRIGDLVGRKYTFLVTIVIMGGSTFLVGLLPGSASLGIFAPIILIALRMLQGLALGGEYGGAATYVAEHAPNNRRGFFTSWIQTTATLGLFKALTNAANPALAQAEQTVKATVTAAPGDCNFQFNATGTSKFTTSCDVATSFLAKSSVPYETVQTAAPGTPATITIGDTTIQSYDAVQAGADAAAKQAALAHGVNLALQQAGFPLVRDTAKVPDSKLDAFVAANPELQLNADAIRAGDAKTMVSAADLVKQKLLTQSEAESLGVSSEQAVYSIPNAGAFKMVADPAQVNWVLTIAILTILVIYVTMVYGPIAAILVEMFPTRIRYTGMSLPYHIGNGWFGGLLPAGVFALSAAKGDIYYGLWYPIIIASVTFVIGMLFVKETKGVDLNKVD